MYQFAYFQHVRNYCDFLAVLFRSAVHITRSKIDKNTYVFRYRDKACFDEVIAAAKDERFPLYYHSSLAGEYFITLNVSEHISELFWHYKNAVKSGMRESDSLVKSEISENVPF